MKLKKSSTSKGDAEIREKEGVPSQKLLDMHDDTPKISLRGGTLDDTGTGEKRGG